MSYISANLFIRRISDKLAATDLSEDEARARFGDAFTDAAMGSGKTQQSTGSGLLSKAKDRMSTLASAGTGLAGKVGAMAGNKLKSMSTSQRAGMLAGLGGAGALGAGYAAYKAYKNRKAKKQAQQSPAADAAQKAEEAKKAYYSGLYWL